MTHRQETEHYLGLGTAWLSLAVQAGRDARQRQSLAAWRRYAEQLEGVVDEFAQRGNEAIVLRELADAERRGALAALNQVAPRHPYLHGGLRAVREKRLAEIRQEYESKFSTKGE